MEVVIGIQEACQIAATIIIIIPIFYWSIINSISVPEIDRWRRADDEMDISIILPMRNEKKNAIRKLDSMMPEILPVESTKLIVVDSFSSDGTGRIVRDYLSSSVLPESRWEIISLDVPGKSFAINRAMEVIDSEIIIMSDADALISPGWMGYVIENLSNKEIGVVSGVESENQKSLGGFNLYYRKRSNLLRKVESAIDSTVVLEGSLIAWRVSSLGNFRLNENMNADDSQIGLRSLRCGYRSIVDERIIFKDFDNNSRAFSESVRRSQGLSKALIMNSGILVSGKRKKARIAILNSLILYVPFPWAATIFSINAIIALSQNFSVSLNWPFISTSLMLVVLLTKQGRMLARGIIISLVSHCQILLGKGYKTWDPIR